MKQKIAKLFLRQSRGQGLVQKVIDPFRDVLDGTVYLFAIKGLLGITVPYWALIIIVISKKLTEIGLGYLDEHIGFWKAENHYNAQELNPFNQELMARIQNIETLLGKNKLK